MKGLILNIQRYSLHDGGGIRSIVFFKGCPLRCPWCSNPESLKFGIEYAIVDSICLHCKKCEMDIDECPSSAYTQFGIYLNTDEVLEEVLKDHIFYQNSSGGVTLSGGEVLMQADFAIELLKKLKKLGINTAVETSGNGSSEKLLEMAPYVDTFLFDLKIMNEKKAKSLLNADLPLILGNFKALVESGYKVIPRVPLIPNYTMTPKNIALIMGWVKSFDLKEIHLLPFHQYGSKKYSFLGKDYALSDIKPPSDKKIDIIKNKMLEHGLNPIVGGI